MTGTGLEHLYHSDVEQSFKNEMNYIKT
jgi:hypothetical protein